MMRSLVVVVVLVGLDGRQGAAFVLVALEALDATAVEHHGAVGAVELHAPPPAAGPPSPHPARPMHAPPGPPPEGVGHGLLSRAVKSTVEYPDGHGPERRTYPLLVSLQSWREKRPDLVDDDGEYQEDANHDPQLEGDEEGIGRREVDEAEVRIVRHGLPDGGGRF